MIENLFRLDGKIALVTGGSSGIGLMITQGLIESGAKVYIASRKGDVCAQVAEQMNSLGKGECVAMAADLSQLDNIEALSQELAEREDHLDILINNAGISWGAPLGQFPEKGWDKVMNLNVKSPFFLTQSLLPLLKKGATQGDPSRVIMISSVAAVSSNSLSAYSYGPSKAAIAQLGKLLAKELVKDNILVNTIGPGVFESKMTAHFDLDAIAKITPVGRIGRPEDIAGLVIYLCSRAGGFMLGNYIPLDGGYLIQ
ncbi:MAG: SDR family NAD(P)-dependent oxidoreductase [Bacteroidota bacterium]